VWVPEMVCMFGVKKKCLAFPKFQPSFPHNPANRLVTVCLWTELTREYELI